MANRVIAEQALASVLPLPANDPAQRHYLFLAANGPNRHAGRIAQLVAEANKRGKVEMVDEAMQWVKSHEPAKQE